MEQEFIRIVSQLLGLAPDEVTKDADFEKDFGADSLDIYQIILALDEQFEIEITEKDVEGIHTVGEAMEVVKRLM